MTLERWKPRIVAEPPEEELAENPNRRLLLDALRAAALNWAEQREQPEAAPAFVVRETRPDGSAVEWDSADALAYVLSGGAQGVEPPDTKTMRMAVDFTRTVAGRRLAELCLAATGLTAKEVADELEVAPPATDDAPTPPMFAAVVGWLGGHLGSLPLAERALDVLAFHFFYAFGKIAREEAENRAVAAEQRAAEESERAAKAERQLAERLPVLRRGLVLQRTMLNTQRQAVAIARRRTHLDAVDAERKAQLAKEFQYEPLSTYERLAMHALVSIARDEGKLDSHPWALTSGPMPVEGPGADPTRVRVAYPGASEIARIVGHKPGGNGRFAGGIRDAYFGAISSLHNRSRWIMFDVRYLVGKQWVEDTEIRKDLWARLAGSLKLTRGAYLDIHPVAVASHLKSFEDIPNLGAVYEQARDAMGMHQLRDEWAILDDYLRFLASSIAAKQARDTRKLAAATQGTTVRDELITKRLAHTTLLERAGLTEWAKGRGAPAGIKRIREALAFSGHVGTVVGGFDLEGGIWTMRLRHPANVHADPDQLVALTDLSGADSADAEPPGS